MADEAQAALPLDAFRRVEKPWGYEVYWTPPGLPYVGKFIHVNAGARLSLQMHDEKLETWLLLEGRAMATVETASGEVVEGELTPGESVTIRPNRRHRLAGITDCRLVEVSTPETGTTFRIEDDYSRRDQTEAVRREELRRPQD